MNKLKELGLPVPDFEVVKNPDEIRWTDKKNEYCGWVIRGSADKERGFSMNCYALYVPKNEVKKKLDELIKKYGNKEVSYIIYAAWKMKKGGNLMILKDKIILEAVNGIFEPNKTPELHMVFMKRENGLPVLQKVVGNKDLLSHKELLEVLELYRKAKINNVVFEWSFNDRGKFGVWDIIPIDIKDE